MVSIRLEEILNKSRESLEKNNINKCYKDEDINTNLAIKSGKSTLGRKSVIKALRSGKTKLVVIASNTPVLSKSELEYYAMLSKTKVFYFQGNNNELGSVCGKVFGVSTLSILDPGDSDLKSFTD